MAPRRRPQRLKRPRLLAAAVALALAGCAVPQPATILPSVAGAPPLAALPVTALPGWQADNTAAALTAFIRGCRVILTMPADQALGGIGLPQQTAGQAGLWQNACNGAADVSPLNDITARHFFEAFFAVYQIEQPAQITGYFEPEYPGAKNLTSGYRFPLYAKPADPELAALPRAAIDRGALIRKAPVTAYLSSPVDAFMLQTQGAGRVRLPSGKILRVGFDGQSAQPYTPIGRILVANGALSSGDVSFESIEAWLKDNPAQANEIMEQNARYVFLRPLGPLPDDEGAPGALGVPITAGRSIAIDPATIPLGTPVYIATTNPVTNTSLNRLTVAQDTGGVHGAAADLFFGAGPEAEATAGRMMQQGTLFLLLPRPTPNS